MILRVDLRNDIWLQVSLSDRYHHEFAFLSFLLLDDEKYTNPLTWCDLVQEKEQKELTFPDQVNCCTNTDTQRSLCTDGFGWHFNEIQRGSWFFREQDEDKDQKNSAYTVEKNAIWRVAYLQRDKADLSQVEAMEW